MMETILRVIAGQTLELDAEQVEATPATEQLRTSLSRVTLAYNDRERVLVKEIADRETELADVRRARDAASAALVELELADLPELTVMDEAPEAGSDDILSLALKYGGERYIPHDAVREATDLVEVASVGGARS